jgi:tRNA(Arg) A34 adenosine deaminase TadA
MKRTLLRDALRIARDKLKTHPQFNNFAHYCFIIQDNKIVEWATNSGGVPPIHFGYNRRLSDEEGVQAKSHAEFNAWRKAKGLINNGQEFEIINIRLNKTGEMRMSAPCCCCEQFLNEMGCRAYYFTTMNGWAKSL